MKTALTFILLFVSLFAFTQQDSLQQKDAVVNVADTVVDIRPRSPHGGLLKDDPLYNPRRPVGITLLRVTTTNVFNWALARYAFNYDWAKANPTTWKYNLKHGWEWDNDRFGINFIGHPHSGSNYFNVARSNGYSYWASLPFTVFGSAQWEWFGENTRPSKNDLINTPLSGAFLGEILYRISSNILDDRTRGAERVWREILAGIVNPTRALNRFAQKKMFRHTPYEVYQKEPLNITISAGIHKVNTDNKFWTGGTNAILNLQLDYGMPFEIRKRRPFDVFRLRLEGRYGDDKRLIDNVLGYGLLAGKNIGHGQQGTLVGIFQQFDYWNNKVFEVGSLGFGPGILSRVNISRNTNLFSGWHLALVPIAGNNTKIGPDSSAFRDYPFGGGWEARIEERLNIGKWLSLGFNGYYYWIFNYEHSPGKSRIGILKPSIAVRLFKNLSVGFEHHVYYDNHFIDDETFVHLVRTEQKLYLQLFIEDRKRGGRYF
jgi:hypothetical protein